MTWLQIDPPWPLLSDVAKIGGGAGFTYVLLRLIDRLFGLKESNDRLAVGWRTSVLQRLESVERESERLRTELDTTRADKTRLEGEVYRLTTNVRIARERYHRLVNALQSDPNINLPRYVVEDWIAEPDDLTELPPPRGDGGDASRRRRSRRQDDPPADPQS